VFGLGKFGKDLWSKAIAQTTLHDKKGYRRMSPQQHHHQSPHHEQYKPGKKLHQNWLFIVAVILMIIAMAV